MELIVTGDGSHTLYTAELDETFHSRHGAIRESMHVFIRHGFRHYLSMSGKKSIYVFELGLGTGLNALLTALESRKFHCRIFYEVVEPFPLQPEIYRQLNYEQLLPVSGSPGLLAKIHETGWSEDQPITDQFILRKQKTRFEDYNPENRKFDIIYYDAFAPGKQPDIWEPGLLQKAFGLLVSKGILVTYCAQGNFKRNLRKAGFSIETLPGPPGKKEMVRAEKIPE
jgi:tRNA U34 5-methylaminomethyl-2-thiouridine-forming methyltransferase MnmC